MRLDLRKAIILSTAIKLQFRKEGLPTEGVVETVLQHASKERPRHSNSDYVNYWFQSQLSLEKRKSKILNFLEGPPIFENNLAILKFKKKTTLIDKYYNEYDFTNDLMEFIFEDFKKHYPEKVNKVDVFVLDMSNINYISKVTIGQLILLRKKLLNDNRFLVLLQPQENIEETFRIMNLEDYFLVSESLTKALAKINSARNMGIDI